jgi:N-acetylmuramoyl-L-alanine amidase
MNRNHPGKHGKERRFPRKRTPGGWLLLGGLLGMALAAEPNPPAPPPEKTATKAAARPAENPAGQTNTQSAAPAPAPAPPSPPAKPAKKPASPPPPKPARKSAPPTPAATGASPSRVTPRPGEGIYTLLRRCGISPTHTAVDAFIQLNQDQLGPNHTLRLGRKYQLPSAKETDPKEITKGIRTHHALFGPKYAWVKHRDNLLSRGVFYLVSGHGGPDPGAMGTREGHVLTEDEYAYDIVLRLARVLIEHGATVHMIIQDKNDGIRDSRWLEPDKDEVTYPNQPIPLNQIARLRQRVAAINRLYDQRPGPGLYHRVVVVHVDARNRNSRVDVFFYYHRASAAGKRLAQTLRDVFEENYRRHQPGRGYRGSVTPRGLYLLNATVPPAVFIELGNIRNRNNQFRFIDPQNRQALAEWIAAGLIRDYQRQFGGGRKSGRKK